jgi:RHS repeat-associated protein
VGAVTSQHAFTADGRLARLDTGTPADVVLDPAGRRMAKRENGLWRDYVYLGDRLVAYFDEGATEAILVISDHIGMPMMAVDGTGSVVWQAKAEPYGQLRGTVNKPFDPGLRYPGQWQDELAVDASCVGDDCTMPGPLERSFSLFENGYRWYRPDWGGYSQADPMGLRGGGSLFEYARHNPQRLSDEFGLWELDRSCIEQLPASGPVRIAVRDWCRRIKAGGVITDPKLESCIKKRCESGTVKCGCCDDPNRVGVGELPRTERHFFGLIPITHYSEDAWLCSSNHLVKNAAKGGADITVDAGGDIHVFDIGAVVIHEWAHTCGWHHNQPGGVPYASGNLPFGSF